jgi:hypothetical protein
MMASSTSAYYRSMNTSIRFSLYALVTLYTAVIGPVAASAQNARLLAVQFRSGMATSTEGDEIEISGGLQAGVGVGININRVFAISLEADYFFRGYTSRYDSYDVNNGTKVTTVSIRDGRLQTLAIGAAFRLHISKDSATIRPYMMVMLGGYSTTHPALDITPPLVSIDGNVEGFYSIPIYLGAGLGVDFDIHSGSSLFLQVKYLQALGNPIGVDCYIISAGVGIEL